MTHQINWKKIGLYLLLSFGISWTIAGIMKLLDLQLSSTISTVLIATLYMPAPAIATFIIQKWIYKENFLQYGWAFDKKNIKWFGYTILLFLLLIVLSFIAIGIFGNTHLIENFGQLDFSQRNFDEQLLAIIKQKADIGDKKIPSLPAIPMLFVFLLQGIVAGITINLPFVFGEELGWRGLLLKETQKMGFLASSLFIGIVWGIWHLPIILMGHNYPTNPQMGALMMCLFTTAFCPLFAYIRLKTQSILGPSMLHGMINAVAAIFLLYVANGNPFCSSIAGWAGVFAGVVITILIYVFDRQFVEGFAEVE